MAGGDISTGGRASYVAHVKDLNHDLYLYHTILGDRGFIGRWIIGSTLGSRNEATVFINSWAVAPQLTNFVNDPDGKNYHWSTRHKVAWLRDPSISVVCADSVLVGRETNDNTFFFEATEANPLLSGFFVERTL